MEKNQQNRSGLGQLSSTEEKTSGQQPGQQISAEQQTGTDQQPPTPGKMERHSESSFPQKDEETLGTP